MAVAASTTSVIRAAALPSWLSGWTDTGDSLGTSVGDYTLHMKEFAAGQVSLDGNSAAGASGASSNYVVVVEGNGGSTPPPPNQNPVASFTAAPTSGEAPLNVDFDASASSDSDGSIVDFAWDFGDGSSGSGQLASHQFVSAGDWPFGSSLAFIVMVIMMFLLFARQSDNRQEPVRG